MPPAIIVGPQLPRTGDAATAERGAPGVDMNGWHARVGFLVASPALLVASRPRLAALYITVVSPPDHDGGSGALQHAGRRWGRFAFPNNGNGRRPAFRDITIWLSGAAHYYLVEQTRRGGAGRDERGRGAESAPPGSVSLRAGRQRWARWNCANVARAIRCLAYAADLAARRRGHGLLRERERRERRRRAVALQLGSDACLVQARADDDIGNLNQTSFDQLGDGAATALATFAFTKKPVTATTSRKVSRRTAKQRMARATFRGSSAQR